MASTTSSRRPRRALPTTISEAAARTGLTIDTLRYYEREGLLADPVSRDSAGRRVYTDSDLAWLRLCVVLRATGMPLAVLRRYTELAREGDGTEPARLELLRTHGQVVRARIAEWERSSRT